MPSLIVITRAGTSHTLEARVGRSLMEVLRDSGVDDIAAVCGGMCSCATCHVFIESDHEGDLPPVSSDEEALLDSLEHRSEKSRLSCQIRLTEMFADLTVTIAPEE